ncbi:hypothetical protein CERSUDRAFT_113551 [Gelatoporia subvermispora B]|uniref:Uncharacterized protein n=1 Tax=Ceriporiopsis subvermispora (strain B) TaxID=914234 RepID=M2RIV1_CERS8|nr:hypothetical protein CERSUDRAFT_113551 [Gelatoporia subvermispora B]
MAAELCRQLRLLLESSPDAPSLSALLVQVDHFTNELSASPNRTEQLRELEEGLQSVHDEEIDHVSLEHAEAFLAVLHGLRPVLPPTALISTWFELVLRPALREPRLPISSVDQAKELVIAALDAPPDGDEERAREREKVGEFRRRLMDFYLLDAFNESSGEDVLEWADLDDEQRERKTCWKANLEDILVSMGLEKPQDFFTELYRCFVHPSSRLQLLMLFSIYTSHKSFPKCIPVLAAHPLLESFTHSLLFDNSSTVATLLLTILTKLLPLLAVHAPDHLKRILPSLLVALARIICWRARLATPHVLPEIDTLLDDPAFVGEGEEDKEKLEDETDSTPTPIREDVEWERLERTFDGPTTAAPSAHRFFTMLYFLFPCNVIRFLRWPVRYLTDIKFDSLYTIGWDEVLDEDKIRSKAEPLLRGHILHPFLIWRGAAEELSKSDFWTQYDESRILAECTMLDVRNAAVGMRERAQAQVHDRARAVTRPPSVELSSPPSEGSTDPTAVDATVTASPTPAASSPTIPSSSPVLAPTLGSSASDQATIHPAPLRPREYSESFSDAGRGRNTIRVSLQDMLVTSMALKSGMDVEIEHPTPGWSAALFPERPRSSSRDAGGDSASIRSAERQPSSSSMHGSGEGDGSMPSHAAQAIAALQREALLLRNELNFEMWMTRENVKHIGRLYEDRVLSRTAEVERQGLHNKLREYKAEVARLKRELSEHKDQATKTKNNYMDWNRELQDKLSEFRNEKKMWQADAAAKRAADKEAKDTFAAQGKLLAEAVQRVFQLETKIKENAHKVDRLHDYERQIDQLITLQRLWELDVQKLNDQADYLQAFTSKYRKMELRLESHEKIQTDMEDKARNARHQIESLEAQLRVSQRRTEAAQQEAKLHREAGLSESEYAKVQKVNERLREENSELRDEVEEMKAMIEVLKGQMRERTGLLDTERRPYSPLAILSDR